MGFLIIYQNFMLTNLYKYDKINWLVGISHNITSDFTSPPKTAYLAITRIFIYAKSFFFH